VTELFARARWKGSLGQPAVPTPVQGVERDGHGASVGTAIRLDRLWVKRPEHETGYVPSSARSCTSQCGGVELRTRAGPGPEHSHGPESVEALSCCRNRPCRPVGLRDVKDPTMFDTRLTDGDEVVSPTHRPRSLRQKHYFSASGTHFC
jgi:hypothetical protein